MGARHTAKKPILKFKQHEGLLERRGLKRSRNTWSRSGRRRVYNLFMKVGKTNSRSSADLTDSLFWLQSIPTGGYS